MVLQNFIVLEEGKATVMHLEDHEIQERAIRDPLTSRAKIIKALVFRVDELNGQAVSSEWSITSERAASNFEAFLADKSYVDRIWTVTPRGAGFLREFEITSTPRGG